MEYAIAAAKRMTLPQLRLYTNVAMVENLAIYAHMGFVETHRAVEHDLLVFICDWLFD